MVGFFEWLRETLQPVFSDMLLALIIILAGFILGRLLGKLLQRVLGELSLSKMIAQATGFHLGVEQFFGKVLSYAIYFIAIVMALDQLGLKTYIINIISAGFLIIIILSVFLSIKDFVPNIMAGLFLLRKRKLKEGTMIRFQNIEGKVLQVSLVETKVQARNKDTIYIPNALLTKHEFVELSVSKKKK